MRFAALDVETANADMASICSIGVATFDSGQLVDEWHSLVDPRDYFDDVNVSIHGITERDVAGAPDYAALSRDLAARLSGAVVVTHNHPANPQECVGEDGSFGRPRGCPKGDDPASVAKGGP
jgi:DNA polymerase-3 subunit epsilon